MHLWLEQCRPGLWSGQEWIIGTVTGYQREKIMSDHLIDEMKPLKILHF